MTFAFSNPGYPICQTYKQLAKLLYKTQDPAAVYYFNVPQFDQLMGYDDPMPSILSKRPVETLIFYVLLIGEVTS